ISRLLTCYNHISYKFLIKPFYVFFFFQAEDGIRDRNVTGVQTCALPICGEEKRPRAPPGERHQEGHQCSDEELDEVARGPRELHHLAHDERGHGPVHAPEGPGRAGGDRKSTRLNSSHVSISYAVFCLKK